MNEKEKKVPKQNRKYKSIKKDKRRRDKIVLVKRPGSRVFSYAFSYQSIKVDFILVCLDTLRHKNEIVLTIAE